MLSKAHINCGDDPFAVGDQLTNSKAVERHLAAAAVAADIETGCIDSLKASARGDTVGACVERLSVRWGYRDCPRLSVLRTDVDAESAGGGGIGIASKLGEQGDRIVGRRELRRQPFTDVVTRLLLKSNDVGVDAAGGVEVGAAVSIGVGAVVSVGVGAAVGVEVGAAVGVRVGDTLAAMAVFDGS
jgi:hypothetical protein